MIVPSQILFEALGTFTLTFAVLSSGNSAIVVAVYAAILWIAGNLSGSAVNPAIALAMYMNGQLTGTQFLFYTVAQAVGAILSVLTYRAL
jgi:glycerol uptake facilitator-like aquaporin